MSDYKTLRVRSVQEAWELRYMAARTACTALEVLRDIMGDERVATNFRIKAAEVIIKTALTPDIEFGLASSEGQQNVLATSGRSHERLVELHKQLKEKPDILKIFFPDQMPLATNPEKDADIEDIIDLDYQICAESSAVHGGDAERRDESPEKPLAII